ncbi:MAG TPA: hypothetical protein VKT81_12080 [Bryobacteraceae bacterium]|nr:hypothetical protein [Bryobacteraceae bacterium]
MNVLVIQPLQTSRDAGLADVLGRLPRLWRTPPTHPRDAAAVLLILAVCAATALIGVVHTRLFGHDIFVMLDAGWRVLHGQRPGADYHPGVGFLLPLLMAAGLKLANSGVQGVGYASALVGMVAGCWSYVIARNRMAWTPAVLVSLLLTLIAVAPYPLGWPPNTFSHAMVYNRYGYALLGVVLLECFATTSTREARGSFWADFSTGILSAALLFLKPSYGLVALGFAACSVSLIERTWRRPLFILLGFSVGFLAIMAWLRFDFEAVYGTLRILSAARSNDLGLWSIRWALAKGLREFLPLALLAVLFGVIRSSKMPADRVTGPLAIALLVLFGGALLLATNAQAGGYPLNAVLAILFVEQALIAVKRCDLGAARGFLGADTVILLVGLLCFLPEMLASATGLAGAIIESRKNPPASQVLRFESSQLSSLFFYDVPLGTDADDRSNGRTYVTYVNDGVNLIRSVSKSSETIYTLDMFNPFSYTLLRPPAMGGADVMALNHQFNDQYKPAPDRLFGSADIVMVPKHPSSAELDARALFRNYLADLHVRYRLCAEDSWWELYKLPSNTAGCPAAIK